MRKSLLNGIKHVFTTGIATSTLTVAAMSMCRLMNTMNVVKIHFQCRNKYMIIQITSGKVSFVKCVIKYKLCTKCVFRQSVETSQVGCSLLKALIFS